MKPPFIPKPNVPIEVRIEPPVTLPGEKPEPPIFYPVPEIEVIDEPPLPEPPEENK